MVRQNHQSDAGALVMLGTAAVSSLKEENGSTGLSTLAKGLVHLKPMTSVSFRARSVWITSFIILLILKPSDCHEQGRGEGGLLSVIQVFQ